MTALVGVLNRHAVAIAADSAVTMGNTHKVINCANKIFTLSKYHPVAVMTYNDASFMGVPWDIIIKEYRKQLGNTSFPYLNDYIDDFIGFIHKRHFFCDERTQHAYLKYVLNVFYDLCCNEVCKENSIENASYIDQSLLDNKLNQCMLDNKTAERCVEFKSYSLEDFLSYAKKDIEMYAIEKNVSNHTLLAESFFYYFVAKFSEPIYTGLVFVGYGEDEIYPSLQSFNMSIGIDGKLKYSDKESARITEHGTKAVIIPFAQVDVTQTIIRGINPSFQNIIYNVIEQSITLFFSKIIEIINCREGNEDISDAIKKLQLKDIIQSITGDINKEMRHSYTEPLMNTIVNLDKEDMANMAESFISLTSLVRRMQPGEETVGGPVDVAVISKGDGFIWINRKHYFKPELNAHFFNNYFK